MLVVYFLLGVLCFHLTFAVLPAAEVLTKAGPWPAWVRPAQVRILDAKVPSSLIPIISGPLFKRFTSSERIGKRLIVQFQLFRPHLQVVHKGVKRQSQKGFAGSPIFFFPPFFFLSSATLLFRILLPIRRRGRERRYIRSLVIKRKGKWNNGISVVFAVPMRSVKIFYLLLGWRFYNPLLEWRCGPISTGVFVPSIPFLLCLGMFMRISLSVYIKRKKFKAERCSAFSRMIVRKR